MEKIAQAIAKHSSVCIGGSEDDPGRTSDGN